MGKHMIKIILILLAINCFALKKTTVKEESVTYKEGDFTLRITLKDKKISFAAYYLGGVYNSCSLNPERLKFIEETLVKLKEYEWKK